MTVRRPTTRLTDWRPRRTAGGPGAGTPDRAERAWRRSLLDAEIEDARTARGAVPAPGLPL